MATYTDPTIIQLGDKPRISVWAWVVLGGGVLSILGSGWFFFQVQKVKADVDTLNTQISSEQGQLKTLQPTIDDLKTLSQTSKDLHLLFDNQKKWDAIIGTIEQRFYKNMTVTSLQLADDGTMSFAGSTPTYTDYAKIFQTLTDASGSLYFASVRPGTLSKVEDKVKKTETIEFSFSTILQKNITQVQVVKYLSDLSTPPSQ